MHTLPRYSLEGRQSLAQRRKPWVSKEKNPYLSAEGQRVAQRSAQKNSRLGSKLETPILSRLPLRAVGYFALVHNPFFRNHARR